MNPASSVTWKFRRGIFILHQIIGLILGIFFCIQGLTGSLLVFSPGWDAKLNPTFLKTPQTESPASMPLEDLIQIAQKHMGGKPLKRLKFPKAPNEPYEICFRAEHEPCLYLNPYTVYPDRVILGQRNREHSLPRLLLQLHEKFFLGDLGETLIGILGILLLFMSLAGIWLWWPLKRFRNIQTSPPPQAFWRKISFRFHRWLGFGLSLFLITTSLTGIGMVFSKPCEQFLNWITGSGQRIETQIPKKVLPPSHSNDVMIEENLVNPSLTKMLFTAYQVLPGGQDTMILWPQKAGDLLQVRKKMPGELHPNGRTRVYIDTQTGEVKKIEDARVQPLGTRMMNLLYPLHTGYAGGLLTRLIQFMVGLGPLCLFLSGIFMWRNRKYYQTHQQQNRI